MTVIDDCISAIATYYNSGAAPRVENEARRSDSSIRPVECVWVSNPNSFIDIRNPAREIKNTSYEVIFDIIAKTDARRDNIREEVHRIIEVTGVTDYHNHRVISVQNINEKNKYTAIVKAVLVKVNQQVGR